MFVCQEGRIVREYLESFMTECGYPDEARKELLSAFDKLKTDTDFYSLIDAYADSYNVDYTAALASVREIALGVGVHKYTAELLLFLCYTQALQKHYENAGIPLDIYRNTVLDLKYKLDECKCVYGVWGSFVAYWFPGFFKLERFALGRLQFELVSLGTDYSKDGVVLTPDSKVINVHIPRTRTPLSEGAVTESYRLAAEFFRPLLGDEIAFICNSWLLFPRHNEMLSETSNIRYFISDYELMSHGEYKDYSETWRLFDTMYSGDIECLPADTSLRRAYVKLIKRGEHTGWGKGIFIYKKA